MKLAAAFAKRTTLNMRPASALTYNVYETNNNLRLRLRLQNKQQPNKHNAVSTTAARSCVC